MSFNPIITWKRRYAHTAADLRVRPWFSNRADLGEPWASRTIKKYTMGDV
jgi:hypothetical protein